VPSTDVSLAKPLVCNRIPKVCFQGQTTGVVGGFHLTPDKAQAIVRQDPKSAVFIHPVLGGDDLLHSTYPQKYVIDLPQTDQLEAMTKAPGAMAHLRAHVLPVRQAAANKEHLRNVKALQGNPKAKLNKHHANFLAKWWQYSYRRAELVNAIEALPRFIALTIVAGEGRKSIYQFVDSRVRPDASVQAFAFDVDYSFGVLSSHLHRSWFDERCSRMKVDPRYTPTTVFDTFPWPANPDPVQVVRVAAIVGDIVTEREKYVAQDVTLAQQYDVLRQPGRSKLGDLHDQLDEAVLDIYGFSRHDDALAQLLALNFAAHEDAGVARRPGGAALTGAYTTTYRLTAPAAGHPATEP
jgi:hypothetical protein